MRRRLAGAIVMIGLMGACGGQSELPVMMTVGSFSLTDHQGNAFGSEDLRGHVWIGDLMFTECPDVCPLLTNQMANLAGRIEDPELRLVSFSVDPQRDTVNVLAGYVREHRAGDARWHFLTGGVDEMGETIAGSLHLPAEVARDGREPMHFERFFLVDAELRVRGLYERAALPELERHAEQLLD